MYSYYYVQEIELDKNLITSENNAIIALVKEAEIEFKKFAEQFPIDGKMTIEQVQYLVERQAEWAELVATAYNDIIRCRTNQELKPSNEWYTDMERFISNTQEKFDEMTPIAAKEALEKTA